MTSEALLDAIRSRGVVSSDIRDAAHEAHHALRVGVRGKWTRDKIHAAIVKTARSRSMLVVFELDARAVEATICKRLGVDYELSKWADIMWWETVKNMRISLPSDSWCADRITERIGTPEVERFADAVMAIKPLRRRMKGAHDADHGQR